MDKIVSTKIKNANVLMTILIVSLHSTIPNVQELDVVRTLTDMAVPVFFTISSFLYFQKWTFTVACYKKKVYSRIKSLLLPFVAFNVLFYIYYVITAGLLHLWPSKIIPTNFFDVVAFIWNSEPDRPLWFLKALFFYSLIAHFLGWAILKMSKYSILLVFVGFFTWRLSYSNTLFWLPCFVLGGFCAIHYDFVRNLCLKVKNKMFFSFLSILFFLCADFLFYGESNRSQNALYYLYRCLSPVFVIFFYASFNGVPNIIVKKISSLTFWMYCTHFIVIELVMALFLKICGIKPSWWVSCLVFPVSLAIIILLGFCVKRFKNVWSFLNGFRC